MRRKLLRFSSFADPEALAVSRWGFDAGVSCPCHVLERVHSRRNLDDFNIMSVLKYLLLFEWSEIDLVYY